MKVEDLMIGDWVCLKDKNLPIEKRYFKIKYLAISAGVSWVNQETNAPIGLRDGKSLIPVFRDEVYPIPLTPEILEKNGFVYADLPFENFYEGYGLRIYGGNFADGHSNWYIICGINVSMNVTHVHELQHALRLCKIDKEIVV